MPGQLPTSRTRSGRFNAPPDGLAPIHTRRPRRHRHSRARRRPSAAWHFESSWDRARRHDHMRARCETTVAPNPFAGREIRTNGRAARVRAMATGAGSAGHFAVEHPCAERNLRRGRTGRDRQRSSAASACTRVRVYALGRPDLTTQSYRRCPFLFRAGSSHRARDDLATRAATRSSLLCRPPVARR
jgi:hypothetical protein